jgi:hypothetical protein
MKNGVPEGNRTPDPRFRKPVLYPAELPGPEPRKGRTLAAAGIGVSMFSRLAHLAVLSFLAAGGARAAVCGVVTGAATIASVDASGEFVFADGRRARLGGLALAPGAAPTLQTYVGHKFGVAQLAPRPDRWGRLIVDLSGDRGGSVALDVVLRGSARVRPEFETRSCDAERLEAEAAARAAEEGVWADRRAVLDARDRAALDAADGQFILVAGVVRGVGVGRSKVYLDFAGRGGFSVVVARKAEPLFARRGIDLKALVGRKILVRGVLDDRFGPRIEVADPSMIEPGEDAKETNRGG